ncbi:MAG TPA: hypothetical protein VNZ26_05100 [Vicinamibacterales bacterium]|jgi:hypothetical protein|nr:hypothetical protein [Vicinamibacterales bacterium]
MFLPHDSRSDDDQQLVRYLLGLLPNVEAERLDEASVVDDDLALRLRVVENDLVDAYVSGTLGGDMLEPFESHYLTSPRRRESVRFARNLLRAVDRAAPLVDIDNRQEPSLAAGRDQDGPPAPETSSGDRMPARSRLISTLVAIAALLLVACGLLMFQAARLRSGLSMAQTQSVALDRRTRELEQRLDEQLAANTAAAKELERARKGTTMNPTAVPPALVLFAQTRAGGPIPTLAIAPAVGDVALELQLESNDFPRYQVALTDPASNQVVWHSGPITATSPQGAPTVFVAFPGGLLKPQHYSLALMGLGAAANAEVVGSYTFQVVRR